jgi:eukaryotic-like serine/threonine-protein kinase
MADDRWTDKNDIRRLLVGETVELSVGKVGPLREFAEGGTSLVFEGDIAGRRVAIKALAHASDQKLQRFRAEYLNVSLLPSHSGIARPVHFEDVMLERQRLPLILMPRYADHLQRPPVPTLQDLRALAISLIDSLSFLHDHGIVHRDIKPQNIFVHENVILVGDFGIASFDPASFGNPLFRTRKGERLGNPFSAPEQIEGAPAHPRMDLYAFGQVLQWFVTGSPHYGTSRQRLTDVLPDAQSFDVAVEACLINNPERRVANAAEVRAIIEKHGRDRELNDPWACLHLVQEALAETFPKLAQGVTMTSDAKIIARFLRALEKRNSPSFVWWFDGTRDNLVDDLVSLDEATWLIDGMEFRPQELWVNVDPSWHRSFAIIVSQRMPPFPDGGSYASYQEAGLLLDGRYVSRAEWDNGFAEFDGDVVDLRHLKKDLRRRYLEQKAIFLGSKYHDAHQSENERRTKEIVKRAEAGTLFESVLERFGQEIGEHIHREIADRL